MRPAALAALTVLTLAACSTESRIDPTEGFGPDPTLPGPRTTLLPTVNIAEATRWPEGRTPTPAPGFRVQAFASGLDHPRWLYRLPNGDILVAESNAPPKPAGLDSGAGGGLRAWAQTPIMRRAGARAESAAPLTLLPHAAGDRVAAPPTAPPANLTSPSALPPLGPPLYVSPPPAPPPSPPPPLFSHRHIFARNPKKEYLFLI